ncbi:hypothetical protein [Phage f2b1]|nr:hypothetical protein [Phage f2b1]
MEMYKTVDEAIDSINEQVSAFLGRSCMFHVGIEVVDELRDYTPLDVEDWGVYEDQGEKTVTIYTADAEPFLVLIGEDKNGITKITKFGVSPETLEGMIESA